VLRERCDLQLGFFNKLNLPQSPPIGYGYQGLTERQVEENPKIKKVFDQVSRYASVGLELGFSVAIGIVSGYYLDKWLGTSPWLTIFLLLCGVAAGFKRIYLVLKSLEREQQREDESNPNNRRP